MTQTAISISSLSKSYRIGHRIERSLGANLRSRLRSSFQGSTQYETFWALKDISMDIRQGEVLGIIGRNGAGKTTLLKLLSRITYPTEGRFEIQGRVASLLEVGTGFHPELSGRENIFLNGTILGMSRAEVRSRFDEIVDFSGVAHFLDTPVKRYSSGMFVRLAFAVAAHLEPEVLIVDEVLAVGDAAFQRKCLGKMGEVARQGRTVLFVSHNMGAVGQLCSRAVWLDQGSIREAGDTSEVIQQYLTDTSEQAFGMARRSGTQQVSTSSLSLMNAHEEATRHFQMGDTLEIDWHFRFQEDFEEVTLSLSLRNLAGIKITHLLNHDTGFRMGGKAGEEKNIRIRFPDLCLAPGTYRFSFGIEQFPAYLDSLEDALEFTISQGTKVGRTSAYPSNVIAYMPTQWRLV